MRAEICLYILMFIYIDFECLSHLFIVFHEVSQLDLDLGCPFLSLITVLSQNNLVNPEFLHLILRYKSH